MTASLDSTLTGVPFLDIDPFSDEWLADPYPHFDALRAAGPAFWIPQYETFGVARHAPVRAVLQDWKRFVSSQGVGLERIVDPDKHWRKPSLLIETDPPLHDHVRRVVNRAMNVAALKALRPVWKAVAEEMVDALAHGEPFDAVPALAEAFPLKVFGDAVGLPQEGRENLLAMGNLAFEMTGPRTPRVQAAYEQAEGLFEWAARTCRRDQLRPGGFGAAIHAAVDEGEVTEEQASLLVRSLLFAGVDTTISGIAAALHAFAQAPEQWAILKERPELARTALDEVLRWDSVAQCFFRTAAEDVDLDGVAIPEGSKVMVFFAAANRDPERWSEPDRFDLLRRDPQHVGFGAGIHACVGQVVARQELEVLLEALVERIDRIELTGAPVRRLNSSIYPISRLPIRLVPRLAG